MTRQRPAPGTPHAQTLDEIFGSSSWRTEVIGDGMDERLDRAIPLVARGIGAPAHPARSSAQSSTSEPAVRSVSESGASRRRSRTPISGTARTPRLVFRR
jgi:hypothetical protein